MKYYRVRGDYVYCDNTGKCFSLIKNELLTEKERAKKCPNLSDNAFKAVEIPKNETFMMMGARLSRFPV